MLGTPNNIVEYLSLKGLVVYYDTASHSSQRSNIVSASPDLKKISPTTAFIAYRGVNYDGHLQIKNAIDSGCPLIIFENKNNTPTSTNVPWIQVTDARSAWTALCALENGNPEKNLSLIGVTGTNGKSSTTFMLKAMLSAHKQKATLMGTLGTWIDEKYIATDLTTPDPPQFFSILKRSLDENIKVVIFEVSSIALVQNRLFGLKFLALAYTSFSHDHLDFHGSLDHYWEAKALAFNHLKEDGRALISTTVEKPPRELAALPKDLLLYGMNPPSPAFERARAQFVQVMFQVDPPSSQTTITVKHQKHSYSLPYIAPFAIDNFTAAALLFEKIMGYWPAAALVKNLPQIPGRMQLVNDSMATDLPLIFVDYAHTPDALEKAILTLKTICQKNLWLVFGCGGNRDPEKRPIMGKIAVTLADQVIVTSDNPRKEVPQKIIADICAGIDDNKHHKVKTVEDRKQAILWALTHAKIGDYVLIAGKGHEDYQIIGDQKIHFSDVKIAKDALISLK